MSSRNLVKSHGLQNRIKRIMQSDDEVGKVAAASTHLVAHALEEFLDELVKGAAAVSAENGGKLLAPAHVKAHVMRETTLDFCKEIVSRAPDLGGDVPGDKPSKRRQNTSSGASGAKKKKVKEEEPSDEAADDNVKQEEVEPVKDEGDMGALDGLEDLADLPILDDNADDVQVDVEDENYDDF